MTNPNFETMIKNKKATVRLRVALEAPLEVVHKLTGDPNKRVRRAAERRLKEGSKG
jgi:hypothetical protein